MEVGLGLTHVYQFNATIQYDGYPARQGTVPISYENEYYDLPLINGVGTLDESIVDLDLNGDGDKTDTFGVTWFHNETRQWDAIINDGGNDIHAYSRNEGPPENPSSIRTYYINGKSKLFQLGTETHILYNANNDVAGFGLGNAVIVNHPSPNFELYFKTTSIIATDFFINGTPAGLNYTWSGRESVYGEIPYNYRVYVVPDYPYEIDSGEIVIFSCTLIAHETTTCDLGIIMNWSPDNNTRLIWVPVWQQL